MKQRIAASLFIICGLLCSSYALAERFIIGAQNLTYFPHYDFESDVDKGVGWAILEAFSEASDHEFIYVSLPIRRLQMELAKGNIDFVYPDNPRWYNSITNTDDKTFSLPLTYTVTGTMVKKDKAGKGIDSIKQLAIPLGFTPVNWQQRINNGDTQLTAVQDIPQGLALLQQERVDALDLEYNVARHSISRLSRYDDITLDLTLPHNEIPFSLSTLNNKKVIDELNTFIATNPTLIASIIEKYEIAYLSELYPILMSEQGLAPDEVWSKEVPANN